MAVTDFNPIVNSRIDPDLAHQCTRIFQRIRRAILTDIAGGGASAYASANEAFLVMALSGDLNAERRLVVGAGGSLVFNDGGADANATLTRAAITGDVAISADANVATLASIIAAAGPIGSATVVPIITYDAKGRLTVVSSATIAPLASSIASPAALTRVDDTNVTLTLGGTPASALLAAVSLTLGWTGQLAVARGGTGAATLTGLLQGNGTGAITALGLSQGDIIYASAANVIAALAKNTTATRYLSNTGSSNNPAWAQIDLTNGVTGILPRANISTVGTPIITILERIPPATLQAQEFTIAGTSTPAESLTVLAFDDATVEYMDYKCWMSPQYIGTTGIKLVLRMSAANAANDVKMEAAFRRIETADDFDTTAHTYSYQASADTTVPATIGKPFTVEIDFDPSEIDSVAAGEFFILRLKRTAAASNMADDAYLWGITGRER